MSSVVLHAVSIVTLIVCCPKPMIQTAIEMKELVEASAMLPSIWQVYTALLVTGKSGFSLVTGTGLTGPMISLDTIISLQKWQWAFHICVMIGPRWCSFSACIYICTCTSEFTELTANLLLKWMQGQRNIWQHLFESYLALFMSLKV